MPTSPPRDTPSPCVAICIMDPKTDLCRGCYRTIAEIGGWLMMSHAERLRVLDAIAQRRVEHGAEAIEAERAAARQNRRAMRRRASSRGQ